MIVQSFYLDKWDWYVTVYYAVDTYYMDDILGNLEEIGCSEKKIEEIAENLVKQRYNSGLTYSNLKGRCSVIVIGLTSSPAEFQNTFDHEKGHLAMHICDVDNIDPFSEEYQYLTGEIGQAMFPIAKNFLCVHCRVKLKGGE